VKAHVTKEENRRFKKLGYTTIERQIQYARAILKRKPNVNFTYLQDALKWKFGSNLVYFTTYLELRKNLNDKN